jgi:hypothetical protein
MEGKTDDETRSPFNSLIEQTGHVFGVPAVPSRAFIAGDFIRFSSESRNERWEPNHMSRMVTSTRMKMIARFIMKCP